MPVECSICGALFNNTVALNMHVADYHRNSHQEIYQETTYPSWDPPSRGMGGSVDMMSYNNNMGGGYHQGGPSSYHASGAPYIDNNYGMMPSGNTRNKQLSQSIDGGYNRNVVPMAMMGNGGGGSVGGDRNYWPSQPSIRGGGVTTGGGSNFPPTPPMRSPATSFDSSITYRTGPPVKSNMMNTHDNMTMHNMNGLNNTVGVNNNMTKQHTSSISQPSLPLSLSGKSLNGIKFITENPEDDPLNNHIYFNTTKETWDCGICRKSFREKNDLFQHLRSGTHEAKRFSCSDCGKAFASIGALAQHVEQSGHSRGSKTLLQEVDHFSGGGGGGSVGGGFSGSNGLDRNSNMMSNNSNNNKLFHTNIDDYDSGGGGFGTSNRTRFLSAGNELLNHHPAMSVSTSTSKYTNSSQLGGQLLGHSSLHSGGGSSSGSGSGGGGYNVDSWHHASKNQNLGGFFSGNSSLASSNERKRAASYNEVSLNNLLTETSPNGAFPGIPSLFSYSIEDLDVNGELGFEGDTDTPDEYMYEHPVTPPPGMDAPAPPGSSGGDRNGINTSGDKYAASTPSRQSFDSINNSNHSMHGHGLNHLNSPPGMHSSLHDSRSSDPPKYTLFFSGASVPQSLKGVCVWLLHDDSNDRIISEATKEITQVYSNSIRPEYEALHAGLTEALSLGIRRLRVASDAEVIFIHLEKGTAGLIYCQSIYRVVEDISAQVRVLCRQFNEVSFDLVSKDNNLTHAMAQQAVDNILLLS